MPADLVVALFSSPGMDGGTSVFVGDLPSELDGKISLGSPSRLVGGIVRGSRTMVVAEMGGSEREATEAYDTVLEEAGWRKLTRTQRPSSGFQTTTAPSFPDMWCRDDRVVQAFAVTVSSRTYLRIDSYVPDRRMNPCDAMEESSARNRPPWEGLTLPVLEVPAGATVRSLGNQNSRDAVSVEAIIRSDVSAAEVFHHYARQLTALGWEPGRQSPGDDASIGRWTTEDDEGGPAVGLLTVWAVDAGTFKAVLRMEHPPVVR